MDLLNRIENTEHSYIQITSDRVERSGYTIFRDRSDITNTLQSYTYIEPHITQDRLKEIVELELIRFRDEELEFLRLVFPMYSPFISELPEFAEAQHSHYQIFHLHLPDIEELYADKNCDLLSDKDRNLLLEMFNNSTKDQQNLMYRWIELTIKSPFLNRVIYKDDRIIKGSCELYRCGDMVKLDDLEVADLYRRQGIATKLLQSAVAISQHWGCKDIYLITESDSEVNDLYRNSGLSVVADYNSVTFYR